MDSLWRFLLDVMVVLLFSCPSFTQKSGVPPRVENLYFKALSASIIEMEKSWSHIDDSDSGSRVRTDYHHMIVETDPEITDGLPSQFEGYQVEFLNKQEQIARYKELGKGFSILRIHPIKNDGNLLKIVVSVSYLEYERGKLRLAVSDWSDVEFRYDCEKQNYIISSVKLGGI